MSTDVFTRADQNGHDTFDLDGWISGARLPEKSVTVYGRADLVGEYQELEIEFESARRNASGDERLGGTAELDIAQRMVDVQEQMQASALTFRFRALSKDETKPIFDDAPKDKAGNADDDYVATHWVAAASVHPKITPEQAGQIRERIGQGQFGSLWDAAYSATTAKRIDIPFSYTASAALSTRDSSSS
jgi:hypothetical protein